MSSLSYNLFSSYEWYGTFNVSVNGQCVHGGGVLRRIIGEPFEADIVIDCPIHFEFNPQGTYNVTALLIDREKNFSHCALLNCFIYKTKINFGKNNSITCIKLFPAFALFSETFFDFENEFITSANVEYSVWPEFNYPQGFKSSKVFQETHWNIGLNDQFIIRSHEGLGGHPISAKHFKAGEVFVGSEDELGQLTQAIKPVLEEAGDFKVHIKAEETHRWYLSFQRKDKQNKLSDFTEKIWAFAQLLYTLAHDNRASPTSITIQSKLEAEQYTHSSMLLYSWPYATDKTFYTYRGDALNMAAIGAEPMQNLLKTFFERYEYLSNFLSILWHNNTERAFSVFHVSRIIDCWTAIGGGKPDYQKIFEEWANNEKELIDKVNELFKSVVVKERGKIIDSPSIGDKIEKLRANIVHFIPGSTNYNIEEYLKTYPFLELVVIDHIFSQIGLEESLRMKYKKHYLRNLF